ncbi:peptidoglycan-binding domain-containing protein [Falsiroseomonas sp.]|uniref:peptidoglycan-binding domain-containing protein n=1 Tax=Falsiroseomonas sp. TaxID=2870721 RepID=UPI003564E8BB
MKSRIMGAVALGLLTAACGTTPQERTTGGAAAGAATGAGIGALGGPGGALAGAAIGGGVGAVTGAVTEPSTVNLGEPPWNNPQARVPGVDLNGSTSASASGSATSADPRTRQLQQALDQRGYDPGPIDGIYGPRTRAAVREWQRANNMQATGTPTQQMLSDLNISSGSGTAGTGGMQRRQDRATGGNTGTMGSGAAGAGSFGQTGTGAVDRNPMTPPPGGGSQQNPFINSNRNPGNEGTGNTGGQGSATQ